MTTNPSFTDLIAVAVRRERTAATGFAKLAAALDHEEWATPYRHKLAGEGKAIITRANEAARQELGTLASAFLAPYRARIAEGPRLDADAMAEVGVLLAEYRDRPRGSILRDIDRAFEASATRRAAILGRVAVALGQMSPEALGGDERYERVARLDPEYKAAVDAVATVEYVAGCMSADIERERARALGSGPDHIAALVNAKTMGYALGMDPAWAEGEGDSIVRQRVEPALR